MKWVVVLVAVLFAVMGLSMIAPVIMHDPFSIAAAFMVGIFVGMILGHAMSCSSRYSEDSKSRSNRGTHSKC